MRLMVIGACICFLFVDRRSGLAGITLVAVTVVIAMVGLVTVLHRLPPWFSGPLLAFVPGAALALRSPVGGTARRPCHNKGMLVLPWPGGSENSKSQIPSHKSHISNLKFGTGRFTTVARRALVALQAIALGIFGWVLVGALGNWRQESAMIWEARAMFLGNLVELQRRPDRIYVTWGGVFPYELILNNEDFRTVSKLRMISLGCLSQTPINNERLHELGIEDLYRSMFQDPRVQVFCHKDYGAHFMRYVHEHYGKRIQGHVLEAKPLGEYPIFRPTEGRYDLLNRLFWLQEFRERP
jgi:hypothetical protein